ncbi:hypothetical protein GGR54DRAFT_591671 [Hypoxylon sp. NC1633]|nr:hypothetical protein GGR54DRAFT_591671 [Hypoxylon sp. NC1633]
MARLAQAPMTPGQTISNTDSLTDLNRLLSRLQENILHADAERERRLRTSEYERSKARVNIDYARSLLTKLEQDAVALKVHARRQEMQSDLNEKREVLELVNERFRELEDIGAESDEEDSEEGEDLLAGIIDTPSESVESASGADQQQGGDDGSAWEEEGEEQRDGEEADAEAEIDADESSILPEIRIPEHLRPHATPDPDPAPTPAAGTTTTTSQTLRPRTGAPQLAATTTATTTATEKAETTALRTHLFGTCTTTDPTSTNNATATATATTEAIIDYHRAQQDELTQSMVGMARALKESSHRFASSLREDEDVLGAAGRNLERNERGLGVVAGRLGLLRRVTEGQGWWGRVMLYLWIFGLAVAAVLVVFVLPKLRF